MSVLVLGVGNLLLQDEAAGVRAIEEFERRYVPPSGVEILDGGTCGIELLQYVEGRELLVLVDVVRTGAAPGTISRFVGDAVPAVFQSKISPHQLGLSDLLATLRLLDKVPAQIVLLGVEPKVIETGLEMSPEITAQIPVLVEMIAQELRALGLSVEARG